MSHSGLKNVLFGKTPVFYIKKTTTVFFDTEKQKLISKDSK